MAFADEGTSRVASGESIADALAVSPNLWLDSGTHEIGETIELPPYGGGMLRGNGPELSAAFSSRPSVSRTAVAWAGEAGGTMFTLDGQVGLGFEGLSFVGKASATAEDIAGVCHHWRHTGSYGSGEAFYKQVSFQHFGTAIECAAAQLEGTCAGIHFVKVTGQDLDCFLKVNNDQGLNYILDHCSFNFIDRVCHFVRGGNLDVRNGNLAGCGHTNWCFELAALGNNLFANTFRNLRIEQGTKRLLKFSGSAHVVIEGLTEAQANQAVTMIDMTGGRLTIRDSRLVTHDATDPFLVVRNQPGGSPGVVIFENVHFAAESFDIAEWAVGLTQSPAATIALRGCTYGANFTRIADSSPWS
jgi:hypothetical protein